MTLLDALKELQKRVRAGNIPDEFTGICGNIHKVAGDTDGELDEELGYLFNALGLERAYPINSFDEYWHLYREGLLWHLGHGQARLALIHQCIEYLEAQEANHA